MFGRCQEIVRCCVDIIIFVITSLLVFLIGVIIGAYTTLATTLGVGAIIAIAAILVVLLIIRIISIICYKEKYCGSCSNKNDNYC